MLSHYSEFHAYAIFRQLTDYTFYFTLYYIGYVISLVGVLLHVCTSQKIQFSI